MAEDKKSFVLYTDQKALFDQLSNDKKGELIAVIFDYVNDLNPDENSLDPLVKMAFTIIKQVLKRDLKKYEQRAERSRANGNKGGRPKEPNKPTGLTGLNKKPKEPDNVNDNDNDNVNVNVNVKDNKDKGCVFNFKKSLLDYGLKKELVEDFLKNRKTKKLTNTETALNSFIEEIEKTGSEKNEVFKIIVQKGWGGFKASWIENDKNNSATNDGIPANPDMNYLNHFSRTPQEYIAAQRKWAALGYKVKKNRVTGKVVDFYK